MTTKKRRSIIRPEVIEARIGLQGEVLLIRPLSFSWLCIFFAALLLGILAFMYWSEFTKTTRVTGVLKNPLGVTKVLPRQNGVIEALYVKEGDRVKKGDKLYQIRTEQTGVTGSVSKQIRESLQQSLRLVEEKVLFQDQLNTLEQAGKDREVNQFNRDAEHLMDELDLQKKYLNILGAELSDIEVLFKKKQIPKSEYNAKYAQFIEKRIAVKALQKQHKDLLQKAENAAHEKENLALQGQSLIVEYKQKANNLQRELANSGAQEAYLVIAPRDGVVSNIYYRAGHTAQSGQILLNIIPADSQLVAEIYIPTDAIGLVEAGQSIQLRYHAFPYQKFGLFEGKIANISKTLIEPHQAEASGLITDPAYRAQVNLDAQVIEQVNSDIPLQPGMTLDADVLGETRSLFSWFFEPLRSAVQG